MPNDETTEVTTGIIVQCECCEENFLDSEIGLYNGQRLCNDCIDEDYSNCGECGNLTHNDDLNCDDYIDLCDNCMRILDMRRCLNCSRILHVPSEFPRPTEGVCNRCIQNGRMEQTANNPVEDSNNPPNNEDTQPMLSNGGLGGMGIVEANKPLIPNASDNQRYRPGFVFHESDTFKVNKSKRHVGFELEVEMIENKTTFEPIPDDIRNCISWKGDGSLDYGREFLTLPANGDKLFNNIDKVADYIRRNKYKIKPNCGVHIHIDARDLTSEQLEKVFWVYRRFQERLFEMMPPSRQNNTYCHKLDNWTVFDRAKYEKFNNFWYKTTRSTNEIDREVHRYAFANFSSYYMHRRVGGKTIEIRLHSGTTDTKKLINWARINLKLFEWAINTRWGRIYSIDNKLKTFLNILEDDDLKTYYKGRRAKFKDINKTTTQIIRNLKSEAEDNLPTIREHFKIEDHLLPLRFKPVELEYFYGIGLKGLTKTLNRKLKKRTISDMNKGLIESSCEEEEDYAFSRYMTFVFDIYSGDLCLSKFSGIFSGLNKWMDTQRYIIDKKINAKTSEKEIEKLQEDRKKFERYSKKTEELYIELSNEANKYVGGLSYEDLKGLFWGGMNKERKKNIADLLKKKYGEKKKCAKYN